MEAGKPTLFGGYEVKTGRSVIAFGPVFFFGALDCRLGH
jgi:hypothetical protein